MQPFVSLVILLPVLLASASTCSISRVHAHRKQPKLDTSQHCGQWDSVSAGQYTLGLDKWGAAEATGIQCAQILALNNNTIKWLTTYNWTEAKGIKSFTNIQLNAGINRQLSDIKSMPSSWAWYITSASKIVTDVAYDLFTSDYPGGPHRNELMIWLGNYNSSPISYDYTADGRAVPTTSNLIIASHKWSLYEGSNGENKVFTFLTDSGPIKHFKGDIFDFFKYLMEHQSIPSSQYLTTAQAGSEAIHGNATLTTTKYSLAIN